VRMFADDNLVPAAQCSLADRHLRGFAASESIARTSSSMRHGCNEGRQGRSIQSG